MERSGSAQFAPRQRARSGWPDELSGAGHVVHDFELDPLERSESACISLGAWMKQELVGGWRG